jgi:hypothetical protein
MTQAEKERAQLGADAIYVAGCVDDTLDEERPGPPLENSGPELSQDAV